VILALSLVRDHTSVDVYDYLASDQDNMVESFQLSLPIPEPFKRTKRDEAQLNSLSWALLKLSGINVDLLQHGFAEEYTVSDNADLFASLLGITRTEQFGDSDLEEMRNTLSKSLVFSGITISVQDVEKWTTKMMESLRVGFRKGYLVQYSRGRNIWLLT